MVIYYRKYPPLKFALKKINVNLINLFLFVPEKITLRVWVSGFNPKNLGFWVWVLGFYPNILGFWVWVLGLGFYPNPNPKPIFFRVPEYAHNHVYLSLTRVHSIKKFLNATRMFSNLILIIIFLYKIIIEI